MSTMHGSLPAFAAHSGDGTSGNVQGLCRCSVRLSAGGLLCRPEVYWIGESRELQ